MGIDGVGVGDYVARAGVEQRLGTGSSVLTFRYHRRAHPHKRPHLSVASRCELASGGAAGRGSGGGQPLGIKDEYARSAYYRGSPVSVSRMGACPAYLW
jgi:hypothetical protein